MQTKQITLTIDSQTYENAERILDDIGLDFQSIVNIMLKRIHKEGNVLFMLSNQKSTSTDYLEQSLGQGYNDAFVNTPPPPTPKGRETTKITEEMRNYIWTIFSQNKNASYTEYHKLADEVSTATGMSAGSAFIYFVILSCFMQGKFNTRVMKIDDIEFYIQKIIKECSKSEFANTLKSLEQSIPYWEDHILGKFAEKVKLLVNQYKSTLN